MAELVRRLPWRVDEIDEPELLKPEWLVTNGLGGYASGTVAGPVTRRHHGLLVAALPAPLGRMVLLSHLWERVRLPDRTVVVLSAEERVGALGPAHSPSLIEFQLDDGLPVWLYDLGDFRLEKRVLMPHGQNTVYVRYLVARGDGILRLTLRPSTPFRPHHAPVSEPLPGRPVLTATEGRYEITVGGALPPLRLELHAEGAAFTIDERTLQQVLYRMEERRGYEAAGDLWSPGYFRLDLTSNHAATLVASVESWQTLQALEPTAAWAAEHTRRRRLIEAAPPPARRGRAAELVLAADQFIITPIGRVEDAARAKATGDEVRSVIAGYHWFTDWGRDTMISLEGLTLTTGRHLEAGYILRTFAHYVRDGLIPNLFPEGRNEGLYHTADATLWFFHALDRYLTWSAMWPRSSSCCRRCDEIIDRHLAGTRFGIGMDPDGRPAATGRRGLPAHLDGREGRRLGRHAAARQGRRDQRALVQRAAVAGRLAQHEAMSRGRALREHAERARAVFNERFWFEAGGYLYDVVDGESGDDRCLSSQSGPGDLASASGARPRRWASRPRRRCERGC